MNDHLESFSSRGKDKKYVHGTDAGRPQTGSLGRFGVLAAGKHTLEFDSAAQSQLDDGSCANEVAVKNCRR